MFRAPRGRTPALGSGQGVYRRDRATQTAYNRNTCAPVPRPVSHLTAAAAAARDRCLRLPKAINTKFEITFVRVRDSSIHKSEGSTESDLIFSIYSLGSSQTPIPRRRRPRRAYATRGAVPGRKYCECKHQERAGSKTRSKRPKKVDFRAKSMILDPDPLF